MLFAVAELLVFEMRRIFWK